MLRRRLRLFFAITRVSADLRFAEALCRLGGALSLPSSWTPFDVEVCIPFLASELAPKMGLARATR